MAEAPLAGVRRSLLGNDAPLGPRRVAARVRSEGAPCAACVSGLRVPGEDGARVSRGRGAAAGHAPAAVPQRKGADHGRAVPGVRGGGAAAPGGDGRQFPQVTRRPPGRGSQPSQRIPVLLVFPQSIQ